MSERVLLTVREVHIFRIPPLTTARGHRAADWDVSQFMWKGQLRVVSTGDKCIIRLVDAGNGQVFVESYYDPAGNTVEPVTDSSRYFVLKVLDPSSGRHAFLGLGFPERNDSFDFNVALQDFVKSLRQQQEAVTGVQKSQPKLDLSLKQGETININLAAIKKKPAQSDGSGQDDFGGFISAPKNAGNGSGSAPSGWVQF